MLVVAIATDKTTKHGSLLQIRPSIQEIAMNDTAENTNKKTTQPQKNTNQSGTLWIALLSLAAGVLFTAHFIPTTTPVYADVIKDRDYQLITFRQIVGGEALGVIDNRTGMMAVFSYDEARRAMTPRAVRPLADAFKEAGSPSVPTPR